MKFLAHLDRRKQSLFPTFRNIYVYDHQTMRQLTIPEGFLLLLKVRNEYWVQEMHGPLHQLKDGRLSKIEGSELLAKNYISCLTVS